MKQMGSGKRGRVGSGLVAFVLAAAATAVSAVSPNVTPVEAAVTNVQFNTDVTLAGREETVWVTADVAGTVSLSIDFDRDGALEPSEAVVTDQPVTAGVNRVVYTVPTGAAFVAGPGALARVTSQPDGATTEVLRELYEAETASLADCPVGTEPVPVSVIQNPSFESREQNFANSSAANTINFAEDWFDRHATGGQYLFFDPPTFDSGPVAGTMPVRAGADGQAFLGGHSSGGFGEGATNTLLVPLNLGSTYVGFFSMAAGGYSRQGDGYMEFFGTNNINMGHIGGGGVVGATAANSESLFSTPVVEYAGNGVRPVWELNTFQLSPTQTWPFLRVEVRNATPAQDGSTAGQVWMNFDDFHMYECTPRQLEIDKTSTATADTRPGDTVTYTVTATNVGEVAYDAANPAVVLDDLTGVLDDAAYNGDATADRGAAPTFANSRLTWIGELGPQETVTIQYSVTVTGGGDGVVGNVAFQPSCVPGSEGCAPPTPPELCTDGFDPQSNRPCDTSTFDLPRLQIVKSADRTALPADGETVTYTVTVTNIGPGDFTAAAPATMTDDLSGVIDDTSDPTGLSATLGAPPVFTSPTVSWSGALLADETSTIAYTVTYDGAGDQLLRNLACVPGAAALDPALACVAVEIPGAGLAQNKVADPPASTPVDAGDQVTYTLAFTNTGNTAAAVDATDDLSGVLDDATLGTITPDAGLSATLNGTSLEVTGSVPVNEVLYVRYTVTVEAFADQTDHVLANVLTCDAPQTCAQHDTEHPIRHLTLTKTADPTTGANIGDQVGYTLTITNDGEGDYTGDDPASFVDDLSDVLDDATYNGDATASAGALTETLPLLTWTGPLPADQSATISYSVTVTSVGDHGLANTASLTDCRDGADACSPHVDIPLPHVVPAKTSDPASGTTLAAGDVVTYTVSFSNEGQAAGPVDSTDDLADIVDDGAVTSGPDSSDPAITAVRTGDEIRITGSLAAGATATITYQVTIGRDGTRGNDSARNVVTSDDPPLECTSGVCTPADPPETEHPIGELEDWKTVDPASGATVQPGATLTYTLHFASTGAGPVTVDRDDVVAGVLDDATLTGDPVASDPALTVSAVTDGRFNVSGTLAAGQEVTVTYTVVVNADGNRGDDALGNFLVDGDAEPPGECVPADPARPDCTVAHVNAITVAKASDPADGSQVQPGGQITYTLTFTGTSANPAAGTVPVDYTDHLADVLDDASLTGGPEVSDATLVATRSGDTIGITGAVGAGQIVTVTYTVTLDPYDAQGNHLLANVVAVTGSDPQCLPELCTNHVAALAPTTPTTTVPPTLPAPTPPAPPLAGELPGTGASAVRLTLLAALVVMAGAVAMAASRSTRRRRPA